MRRMTSTIDALPDPVAAATQPDPYPGYARWRAAPPLVFDPRCGLWVASRAEVVATLLAQPQLRVRPVAEPMPRSLEGSSAGAVFVRLVRMDDGPSHARHKPALQRLLSALTPTVLRDAAHQAVRGMPSMPLDDALFALPLAALAGALGIDPAASAAVAREGRAFATGLSPLATAQQRQGASTAADALRERLGRQVAAAAEGSALAAARSFPAVEREVLVANLIGLFLQTCDATAGLVGLGVLALARAPGSIARLRSEPAALAEFVAEVARHDAPIQNTRRFVGAPCRVHGVDLAEGDTVLLLLAAANRDAALNAAPDDFRIARTDRRTLGFGHGAHACPGQAAALSIAAASLAALLDDGLDPPAVAAAGWRFHASLNARVPQFHSGDSR